MQMENETRQPTPPTHLPGNRDAMGNETALCGAQGEPIIHLYQLNGAPGRFASCHECVESQNRQPGPPPSETLSEKFRGRSWLIGVREEKGELVVETRRWSAVILMEIPDTWEGMPVRILRKS